MPVQKALITGASSGIGAATAHAFARQGHDLFLVARREDKLTKVADICSREGASRVVLSCQDLGLPGKGSFIVEECLEKLGGLDILMCNAGYGIYGPVHQVPPEDMARIWQVNYQSGYESIHTALPHFLKQRRGHVVIVSSIIGKKAFPYSATYCATKFAQSGLAEALWGELRGTGVELSLICPGYTATEFQKSAKMTPDLRSIQRAGGGQSPEIVARSIVKAIDQNRRETHLTLAGKILMVANQIAPSLTTQLITWSINRQRRDVSSENQ